MNIKYSILLTSILLSFNNLFCMQRTAYNIFKVSSILSLGAYYTKYLIEDYKFGKLCDETSQKALEDLESDNYEEKKRGECVLDTTQVISQSYAEHLPTFFPLKIVKNHKRVLEKYVNQQYPEKK